MSMTRKAWEEKRRPNDFDVESKRAIMSKWLNFEKMITQIYQSLSPKATVVHNDSIPL